ncbi:hypothetical protein BBK36DRAFT_1110717 [Trichoderma citrinoviride]|uniref:Uncharacterized protein n=1 Tax=Trichoderma citrinoviride TaxID=58853 RepID=A0A2T4BKA2_9HYPO|nr:hypothetical protein BBK36DRAFT_1110717 [Trichoderma citrinoviride]PTB69744.1 hypothetical protein BBK36DRAFT_1110717 [Trichoderma citrinoviride]
MEPERTSPHSAAVSSDMTAPQLPSGPDALPITASDAPSMPRPRARERQQTQNSLLMELLSRRMSRQTLLQQQQNQSRTSQPPLTPQSPQPSMSSSSHSLVHSDWSASNSVTMEIDVDESSNNDVSLPLPSSSRTQSIRPSRRYLPLPYIAPVAPATNIDPDVASRVLARMQANTQPALDSVPVPTNSPLAPAIEIDPTELVDADVEADEGYGEGPEEEFSWLGEKPSSGLTGALRNQGLLSFTTSAEAALRCPKLVRNVPRMRKRTQKKKEHRLRASRGTNGEPSQAQAPTAGAC